MSYSDTIGDMLTRIRNANSAGSDFVEMPYSNMRGTLARIFKKEGFIQDWTSEGKAHKRILRIYLKYGDDKCPVIRGLRRVSRPGLRKYVSPENLRGVLSGTGTAIISTSSGVLTDREARKSNVGGEWICSIW